MSDYIKRLVNNKLLPEDRSFVHRAMNKKVVSKNSKDYLHHPRYKKNHLHMMDLLYVPHDRGYKYILTMVDAGSNQIGLEPIKNKSAATVLAASKRIYARVPELKIPTRMNFDKGTEFMGVFKRYYESKGVNIKYAIPDRHSETKLVETVNGIISRIIFLVQYKEEAASDWSRQSTQFVDTIKVIETEYNKKMLMRYKKRKDEDIESFKSHKKVQLIKIGTKVYKYAESPRDPVTNKRLGDKFRLTDLKLEKTPRTITGVHLLHNQTAPAYRLSGFGDRHLFIRQDFVLANKDEMIKSPLLIA